MTEYGLGALIRFADVLRELGLSITTDRLAVAAESAGHWHATGDSEPYWPLRVAFCSSEDDVLRFDAAYRCWIGSPPADGATESGAVAVRTPAQDSDVAGSPVDDADNGAGNAGALSTRDFDDLTDTQLREVSAWTELLLPVPRRRSMRRRPAPRGGIDPTRTMRFMLRDGGELLRLRHRRNASSPPRVLVLVDVSASMRPYSDVLLHFGYAALRANPETAEVFAVGTQFARLTGPLKTRRIDLALGAAGEVQTDWGNGTTLGSVLRDFLRCWGGSRAVRSAVVILASDGFEFDDPALLTSQAGRLAALARALIWVDPGHRDAADHPGDEHIARAQAHASTVLGCHSYEALRELAKEITHA